MILSGTAGQGPASKTAALRDLGRALRDLGLLHVEVEPSWGPYDVTVKMGESDARHLVDQLRRMDAIVRNSDALTGGPS